MSVQRAANLILLTTIVTVLLSVVARGQPEELTAERVRQAIQRGVDFLQQRQRADGTWPYMKQAEYKGGATSLCALALLNAGVSTDDPSIQRALAYLRSVGRPDKTYCVALQTMVFCAAEPQKDIVAIQGNAAWLEYAQGKAGPANGAWSYSELPQSPDKSNSQFALLALHEAERVGVKVNETTWRRAENYWRREQREDGSWEYRGQGSSGSMTCAGVASLAITTGRLSRGDAEVVGAQVQCCGEQEDSSAVQRGLDWLGRNFSVRRNPGNRGELDLHWVLYYLYGLERAGRMTGQRFIGRHDWYREGAEFLLALQDPLTGSWLGYKFDERQREIGTAFALLFLSKGRRPILLSKVRRSPEDDWNYHRSDAANLTKYVESKWKRDLNWQIVDLRVATVEDMLQSPVLYFSGRNDLELTASQKKNLQEYVDNGGFLFVETCCGGRGFDRQFRELMRELFPDNPLRLLPPEHPVWYAEEKVNPDHARPLWGIDACCRTSVVYCPDDLSCYWELAAGLGRKEYPKAIRDEIDAAVAMGANVLAYATGRELKEKLDMPTVFLDPDVEHLPLRGTLRIPKLRHAGGSDDAPAAVLNLLRVVKQQVQLPTGLQRIELSATDPSLPDYAVLFMHGRREFRWTKEENEALARYLTSGGFLFADAICASKDFARAFRREIEKVFPEDKLSAIPPTHEIFSSEYRGFDLRTVTVRELRSRASSRDPLRTRQVSGPPRLEGVELNGRYVVVFSPLDISCALENQASIHCHGYTRDDAARIGVNLILYALQR